MLLTGRGSMKFTATTCHCMFLAFSCFLCHCGGPPAPPHFKSEEKTLIKQKKLIGWRIWPFSPLFFPLRKCIESDLFPQSGCPPFFFFFFRGARWTEHFQGGQRVNAISSVLTLQLYWTLGRKELNVHRVWMVQNHHGTQWFRLINGLLISDVSHSSVLVWKVKAVSFAHPDYLLM